MSRVSVSASIERMTQPHSASPLVLSVAGEIRAWAARKGYSQQKVADVLGISQTAVSRLFRGKVAADVADLEALAAEWGVPVTEFLARPTEGERARSRCTPLRLALLPSSSLTLAA